jgi:hypothetical protein
VGLAALASCDIDFIALERVAQHGVAVYAEHAERLTADVLVVHRGDAAPPRVAIEGRDVAQDRDGNPESDGTRFAAEVVLDSLQPLVHVRIEPAEGGIPIEVVMPVLARTGAGRCLDDGDLLLRVVLDRSRLPGATRRWSVSLATASGTTLTSVESLGTLPDPLRLDAALVADSASSARVDVYARGSVDDPLYALTLPTISQATIALPAACAEPRPSSRARQ